MKAVVFLVVVLSFLGIGESITNTCKWTGCEGLMRPGQEICNEYSAGTYRGNSRKSDCGFTSSQVECCNTQPAPGCVLTNSCYGIAYGSGYVCNDEFGKSASGQKVACSGLAQYQHECC